jgi:cysteinyl-tRNA synthetase
MALALYDTYTREKRLFEPLDPARVRMYVCGPTVYDFAHIGNGRSAVVFDVLFRLLRHLYGPERVIYVRNVTDVDDKINKRAAERIAARGGSDADLNAEIRTLTEVTLGYYRDDLEALGCLPPTREPRATEHVEDMKVLIERLVVEGHAYVAEDHVLFSVPSMPEYGRLSKRPLEEMIAGARVDVAPYKRDPMDFVLWKPSGPDEPAWPSPCRISTRGRPGWHIECSAMAWKHLGEVFDIHGGGIDLVFPHHENEIAQSRCAFHTAAMANVWMHNGFLQLDKEKMSKSLGNFFTMRDILHEWPGEAIRFALLQTHYRQPLNWSEDALRDARHTLDQWYALTADATGGMMCADVVSALEDDLNTPKAVAGLHELRAEAAKGSKPAAASLKASAGLMGFLQQSAARWHAWRPASFAVDDAQIDALVAERLAARRARNFKEADRIRDELAALGVALKDSKDGTTWEIAR